MRTECSASTSIITRVFCCHRYTSAVVSDACHPNDLVPPAPELTRYKKELAVKAEAADATPPASPKLAALRISRYVNL